eukprot:13458856-Alexandrium_andersonii.AAC.1
MSASLVGSEMCIRDRAHPRACEPDAEAFAAIDGAQGAGDAGREGEGRRPVSYTHLTLPTICSV